MFRAPIIFLPTVTYLSLAFKIFAVIVGSIPNFEDVPKTTETFWKETTVNKLVDGSDGGMEVKVYKDEGSSFIRCHNIKSNQEYIHILQQDGTIQQGGIYRDRWDDGNTAIGSKYFRRSGREEFRDYCLFRFNNTGNIEYHDQILGKDDSGWRTLAKYSFNLETLDWTKENA